MRPERRNAVKVLMFLDIGGSMDPHVKACEELFSAARTEFKNLEFFYFHNCIYEGVWKDNRRRSVQQDADVGRASSLPGGLQGHHRGRRGDEPLRDHLSGRLGGALERGAGRDLAAARWRTSIRTSSGSTRRILRAGSIPARPT